MRVSIFSIEGVANSQVSIVLAPEDPNCDKDPPVYPTGYSSQLSGFHCISS